VFIAFELEPKVDQLMVEFRDADALKYQNEHAALDEYHQSVKKSDSEKFQKHYEKWKEAVVRFHKLKHEDAITKFIDLMHSPKFVNSESRVQIFQELQDEQESLHEQRVKIINELDNCRPTQCTANFIN